MSRLYKPSDMTNQLHRVDLSIASPSEIERTARQLMALREEFLDRGTFATYTPRPLILASWQRSHAVQVDPARRWAPLAIARETELHELREANEQLVYAARPVMSHLTDFLADSGYVVVLSDAHGRLLDVIGDPAIRRRLARIDFVPGSDWSEAAAGTNAIGTALADSHVVQLMAAEHYCEGWQDLTCTAAPIRHPLTGEVIGVLDLTGDYRLIRSFLTGLLAAAALEIEQKLAILLTPMYKQEERQAKLAVATASFASRTSPLEISREIEQPYTGKGLPEPPTEDGMRSWLNLQERSAPDAGRLIAATGAISASLDLKTTLEQIAEQTAYVLRLESAAACLFDETGEAKSLHIWSRQDLSRLEIRSTIEALLRQTTTVSLIRERGEPVIIDDIFTTTLVSVPLIEQLDIHSTALLPLGIHSIALLPLTTARKVIGCIIAPRYISYHWTADDVRLGLALAAQAATAIENALLFDALQRHHLQIEALHVVEQLLNSLPDPSQHLDLVLERIVEVRDLDAGMIFLLDQDMGHPTLVAHYGLPQAVSLELNEHSLRPFYDVANRVMAGRKSLLIPNEWESLRSWGFCDLMVVPVAARDTSIGVLLIGSHNPQVLTKEDLALFTSIGQQLGLALKNVQLLRSASEMEALREVDRLKSEFLAMVSHDLRSPLTAIRTSVESLLDQGVVQSGLEQEHLLYNIASQASRLGRMVDQLLDLSRIEASVLPLDHEWIDLPVLIADTIAKFVGTSAACRVEQDLPADLPLLYVDPDRLVQVLWNLLENACKYSPPGSPIRVEAKQTGTEVVIKVADHGLGIPAGDRKKIFQHFYRLGRDHRGHTQGCGLGLAICRGIVEAHGGRIWVEDRSGRGSVFHIALPLPATDPTGFEMLEGHEPGGGSRKEQ
jgi:signal transduction histidine kinase